MSAITNNGLNTSTLKSLGSQGVQTRGTESPNKDLAGFVAIGGSEGISNASGQPINYKFGGMKVIVADGSDTRELLLPWNRLKKGTSIATFAVTDDTVGYIEDTLQHDRRVKTVLDNILTALTPYLAVSDADTHSALADIILQLAATLDVNVTNLQLDVLVKNTITNKVPVEVLNASAIPVTDALAKAVLDNILLALASPILVSDSTAQTKLEAIRALLAATLTVQFAAAQHTIVDSGNINVQNAPATVLATDDAAGNVLLSDIEDNTYSIAGDVDLLNADTTYISSCAVYTANLTFSAGVTLSANTRHVSIYADHEAYVKLNNVANDVITVFEDETLNIDFATTEVFIGTQTTVSDTKIRIIGTAR